MGADASYLAEAHHVAPQNQPSSSLAPHLLPQHNQPHAHPHPHPQPSSHIPQPAPMHHMHHTAAQQIHNTNTSGAPAHAQQGAVLPASIPGPSFGTTHDSQCHQQPNQQPASTSAYLPTASSGPGNAPVNPVLPAGTTMLPRPHLLTARPAISCLHPAPASLLREPLPGGWQLLPVAVGFVDLQQGFAW
jgi:hypothetical protein